MAYRATVATSSTECSPYFLMFGRQFLYPIDFDLGTADCQKPIMQTNYIKNAAQTRNSMANSARQCDETAETTQTGI